MVEAAAPAKRMRIALILLAIAAILLVALPGIANAQAAAPAAAGQPGALDRLSQTLPGQLVIAVSGSLFVIGFLLIRKITDIEI